MAKICPTPLLPASKTLLDDASHTTRQSAAWKTSAFGTHSWLLHKRKASLHYGAWKAPLFYADSALAATCQLQRVASNSMQVCVLDYQEQRRAMPKMLACTPDPRRIGEYCMNYGVVSTACTVTLDRLGLCSSTGLQQNTGPAPRCDSRKGFWVTQPSLQST